MIYCFDIDGVICKTEGNDYLSSCADELMVSKINQLYDEGNTIKIFTGRGSVSKIDWRETTERQLKEWGVKYHELIMGKPEFDLFIDDKVMNIKDFKNDLYSR